MSHASKADASRSAVVARIRDARARACESFRPLVLSKESTLTSKTEPGLPKILVDRDRILQVLSNFLNNAVKFTPPRGRISIDVSRDGDHSVRFAITDTGPGIKPEDLPHVFSRYWQAKKTAHLGSGLGLAIAKGIAEAHHGAVAVHSELGRGRRLHCVAARRGVCGSDSCAGAGYVISRSLATAETPGLVRRPPLRSRIL